MRSKSRIIISQHDLSFLRMRHYARFKVVTYGPCRNAAKVFIHVDMTPDKGVHLHVEARFDVGILAVGERPNKQIDLDQFAGAIVYIVHGRAGPIYFCSFSRLMLKMIGEPVGDGEFGIPLIELSLTHGNFAVTLTAFNVFLMEKLECNANPFQFLMYMLIVRISVHGLVRELLWIEETIDLGVFKGADIFVAYALLVSDVEHFTDRVP